MARPSVYHEQRPRFFGPSVDLSKLANTATAQQPPHAPLTPLELIRMVRAENRRGACGCAKEYWSDESS
jgi:hypothetical protein